MKKATKKKISKFENIVKVIAFFLAVAGPVSIVFAKSSLSAVNYKLEKVKKGIQKSNIPARFEVVKQNPIVICDGAHNPEAIHKLISSIEKKFNKEIKS